MIIIAMASNKRHTKDLTAKLNCDASIGTAHVVIHVVQGLIKIARAWMWEGIFCYVLHHYMMTILSIKVFIPAGILKLGIFLVQMHIWATALSIPIPSVVCILLLSAAPSVYIYTHFCSPAT
jgi:hypothetical protein